ncbi:MAG: multidrug efflux RND transporter permease subunit [Thermodesulfobacteriota bacterium]
MFSRFFIDRPIFTTVFIAVILLAGLAAINTLPVAQFPEITPPTVTVTAIYPGAAADVVAKSVAAPLEQQINGLENMLYMSSNSSSNGMAVITVTFDIGTDLDRAALNVKNRVSLAEPALPQEVRRLGVTVDKKSGSILLIIALQSPDGRYDDVFISNYAALNVMDTLKRLPGVGGAQIMGARDYAMRIWIKPDRMAQLGITTGDIAWAIQEQNSMYATGRIGQEPTGAQQELTIPVTTRGRLSEPSEFENIIVRANPDGSIVRLKDVAGVELGASDYEFKGRLNGAATTLIAVNLQPGANALNLAKAVKSSMATLAKSFPAGIAYSIPYDTTTYVEVSIEEVIETLIEAVVLVFLVVFVFLQTWRATLIPTLAVPVSLIGTFAGMYLLGYSINTLTLFGMVLAIGIVVDDAIVVVENVERLMAVEGLSPREATIKAMEEVTGPVVAIVLVLCAVFVPVAFIGGMSGQLYKQFAITIAVSVVFSGITALTLSPVLAALLLRPGHGRRFFLFRWFNVAFEHLTAGYAATTAFAIRRGAVFLLVFAGLLFATYELFNRVPESFVPSEDQGYVMAVAILPDAATIRRTAEVTERVEKMVLSHPAVTNVVSFVGYDLLSNGPKTSTAAFFITFKDWKERQTPDLHANGVLMALFGQFMQIREAMVFPFNPPSIPGLGTMGGFEFNLQSKGEGDVNRLAAAVFSVIGGAGQRPELQGLSTTFKANVPQLFVEVDRDQAKVMGVPLADIFQTIQTLVGSYYVNDFNKYGRIFKVQLQADPRYRSEPDDLGKLFVRSTSGQQVPLGSLIRVSHTSGPELVTRFNGFPSATISGSARPGFSSGQALTAMEEVAATSLPPDMTFTWSGEAYQQQKAGNQAAVVFLLGILMVFLILAAQYERWTLPFSVLLAVPFGVLGALAAAYATGMENDIYFKIGLVTLIGLSAKNAILIVEFAVMKRAEGLSPREAATEAARLRFRPILMTSLAFILGVIPLVTSQGAGAASRHSIGIGVMGGMLAATFLAIFFVPLFYYLVQSLNEWDPRGRRGRPGAGGRPDVAGPEPAVEAGGDGDAR